MRAVILVPRRESPVNTARTWNIVREYLQSLEMPIFTADSKGPWNRSAAINKAAKDAGNWQVALIADADSLHNHNAEQFKNICARAVDDAGAIIPWDTRWKLSKDFSETLVDTPTSPISDEDLDKEDGYSHPKSIKHYPLWKVGSNIVISRTAWEAVNGFDERFVGWGFEDCANRVALSILAPGGLNKVEGDVFHIWHKMDFKHPANPNRLRFNMYQRRAQNKYLIRQLIAGNRR